MSQSEMEVQSDSRLPKWAESPAKYMAPPTDENAGIEFRPFWRKEARLISIYPASKYARYSKETHINRVWNIISPPLRELWEVISALYE